MYSIKKVFNCVAAGHRLSKHEGACKNIHGHNYKIEVQVSAEKLNKNGMVIDFKILKEIVNPFIDAWDHSFIYNDQDDNEIIHFLRETFGFRLVPFPGEPTAEKMAEVLFTHVRETLRLMWAKKELADPIKVDYVTIWETPDSCATYWSRS